MKRKRDSGEASTSNYLPSPEATSKKFDVFLSFRGPDTRNKFTSHLYERMTCVGISVFKDDVEMVEGEGINEALRTAINCSRISIPIFSKDYASSKACLQELSHMVLEDKIIIPIFYDVGVDDVKLKTNLYKKALEDHHREGRAGKEEIEKWENALLEVAKILGYNIVNKNEANEIINITRQIMIRLMPKDQDVTKHLVEIDDEVESVIKMMDSNFKGCRIVGLYGMGGIGKTTLAKAVFNRLCVNFDNCCTFIANVRESAENNQLPKLQQQLYKDLIDPRFADSIDNVNRGINMINKGLVSKKFLLVLDDVDNENLLTNFVGNHFRFANGSRIIITTRNKKVLDDLEKDPIWLSNNDQVLLKVYQVQQLDKNRALQLFSRCAFRRDSPPENFKSLSEAIISSLGGLPLALEVIGSSLRGHSKKAWEDIIKRLKETPNKEIQTSLMISYRKLHVNEKKIFLDIACYPESLEKTRAHYMWESCGWHPSLSIDNLINLSLIKVVDGDDRLWMTRVLENQRLWMHDVLKELGRDIIRKKHKKKGRKGGRFLQIVGDFDEMPKEERKYVEMLRICYRGIVTRNDLDGFENVRFLYLEEAKVEGNFEGLFPNLRWIEIFWVDSFSVFNLNPENLVVLSIREFGSDVIHTFWSQMKAHKLKFLHVVDAFKMERTQSFKEFSSLEVLILDGCLNMVNSMGDLKSLIRFITECHDSFACLPQTIGNAKALEEIVITGDGQIFELPASVYNLENLSRLCLFGVDMRALKDSIGNLISLRELDLSATYISALPDAIGQLKELRILLLNYCKIKKFPTTIGGLMKLEVLEARGCRNFEGDIPKEISLLHRLRILELLGTPIYGMPKLPSSLTHLHMNSFTAQSEIYSHNLFELVDLVELELRCQCDDNPFNVPYGEVHPRCLDFQWIGRLSKLENLSLCIPYAITGLESVSRLSWLEELYLSFAKLQDNWQLPSTLSYLQFNDCKFDILDVSHAKKLTGLEISRCDTHEIRGLRELNSLIRLEIHKLRGLSSLKVWNCKSLKYAVGFDGLESLTDLSIRDCPLLTVADIPYSSMKSLYSVELWNCKSLTCPHMFSGLEFLTYLSVKNLGITSLNLIACGNLESIEGLDGLEVLRNLSIEDCPSLRSLPDLSTLGNSQYLKLHKLERLRCIEWLDTLESLTHLSIEDCPSIRNLLSLSTLRNLQCLKLHRLERLGCIEGLDTLESLTHLSMEDCPSIRNLSGLSTLRNLQCLKLHRLERLGCIEGLALLEFLVEVQITGCQSLELDPNDLYNLNNATSLFVINCDKLPLILKVGAIR